MGETIRDYIKRRVRWGFGIGFVSWLFVALSSTAGFFGPKAGYVPIIGVFGFMGAIVSFMFIRCPKCRTRIGQTIAMPAAMRLFGPQVKFCPYCGVSLDDPMPAIRDDLGR
jgi:hypothetical protein